MNEASVRKPEQTDRNPSHPFIASYEIAPSTKNVFSYFWFEHVWEIGPTKEGKGGGNPEKAGPSFSASLTIGSRKFAAWQDSFPTLPISFPHENTFYHFSHFGPKKAAATVSALSFSLSFGGERLSDPAARFERERKKKSNRFRRRVKKKPERGKKRQLVWRES